MRVSILFLLAGLAILPSGGCAGEAPEPPEGPVAQRLRELAECRRFLERAVDRRVLWSRQLAELSRALRDGGEEGDVHLVGIRTTVSEAGIRTLESDPPTGGTSDPAVIVSNLGPELAAVALEEVLARDAGILMDNSESGAFINVIGKYEKDSGVVIGELRGGKGSKREGGPPRVWIITLEIRMKATMGQLVRFLDRFENHQRLVSVPKIVLPERLLMDPGGETRYDVRAALEFLHVPDRDKFPRPGPIPDRSGLRIRPEVIEAIDRFPTLTPAR